MSKTYYVTTPLYYVNALPHIGHAYTTLAADVLVRHKRARGEKAFLLTGTDEHGANIEKAAKAAGKAPQAWADEVAAEFKAAWERLGVRYDDFIRTSEPRHEAVVRAAFDRLRASGDIFLGHYEGLYCLSCEAYYDEDELKEGRCPVHGRPVEPLREETYFFKLSKYQQSLLDHYAANPDFILPRWRAAEAVNFVKSGLKDLSVTRTKVAWGVSLPSAPGHTMYVWFDALLNYVSAPGWDPKAPSERYRELWPADVQLVGKEILRFHAVIWPAMLMALGVPLPRTVFAHGWWIFKGEKMSKSRGNILTADEAAAEVGVDAVRYALFREMPFGNDGEFSLEALKQRYNTELANTLGNLVSRVIQLVEKNLGGDVGRPDGVPKSFLYKEVAAKQAEVHRHMDALAFFEALGAVWEVLYRLNKHVDEQKPWEKAKSDPAAFRELMFDLVWSLRMVSGWLEPFMPETAAKMKAQLGLQADGSWGRVTKGPALFPRKT